MSDNNFEKSIQEMIGKKVGEQVSAIMIEKVDAIKYLLDIQKQSCTDNYNIGIYNGLAIGLSVLTGEKPDFIELEGDEKEDGVSE